MNYGYSPVAKTYLRILGVAPPVGPGADCRVTYTEYGEDDSENPVDFWFRTCDSVTQAEAEALLTEELVEIYEVDSVPSGEENSSPHCRIAIALPPSGHTEAIRLSEDDTYSPETQALLDYLFGVYDEYAPDP